MNDVEIVAQYIKLKARAEGMGLELCTSMNSRGKLMFKVTGLKKSFHNTDLNVIFGYLQGAWEATK